MQADCFLWNTKTQQKKKREWLRFDDQNHFCVEEQQLQSNSTTFPEGERKPKQEHAWHFHLGTERYNFNWAAAETRDLSRPSIQRCRLLSEPGCRDSFPSSTVAQQFDHPRFLKHLSGNAEEEQVVSNSPTTSSLTLQSSSLGSFAPSGEAHHKSCSAQEHGKGGRASAAPLLKALDIRAETVPWGQRAHSLVLTLGNESKPMKEPCFAKHSVL